MARIFEMVSELACFIRKRKKYWLLPMMIAIFLMSLLLVFGQSAWAPLIYSLW
jgi:type II secretory pathway component PulJ